VGDVVDFHSYPHPNFPFDSERFADYVQVVGEFGGHGLPITGHLWDPNRRNWGYGNLPKTPEEYQARYRESITKLNELRHKGIAAGVYTQTTDVEGEVNGLLTYDRKVIKFPAEELAKVHGVLFEEAKAERAEK
jgi:beta-galactosidase